MNLILTFQQFSRRLSLVSLLGTMVISSFAPIQGVAALQALTFGQINFVPNIETAGVVVSGSGLPATAQLSYRRVGETDWRAGHDLLRIKDGRLIGSLFNLSSSTAYEVKVSDGASEVSGSFATQPDELAFAATNVIHVNDDAPAGGDGSVATPFRTIQEGVNRATPGTQVLVADGIYHESVAFPASGASGSWIQVKAEGGAAILDGSDDLAPEVWIPHDSRSFVWFTKISNGIKYLARDGRRMYQYDDLNGLFGSTAHDGTSMREGWFYDPVNARLYVRSLREPSKYTWQVPRFNQAFSVDGRDWIWIEGFEMRFYGTGYGCGACLKNASHVVVRKNRIHNVQNPVFVEWTGGEDRGNDTRIEYNEMYDSLNGDWPWGAVKSTSMESIAIVLRGHNGAIVRGNNIHNYFNGIYSSSSAALDNPGVAFDADIYNNTIRFIGDDALEPEGTCVNHRFRNNTIDSTLVGISLAPISMGPVWVLRNTFANFTGRSVKWDRGSDGWVLIYHNTSWTNYANPNSLEFISAVRNSIMRNNIFQGNGYSVEVRNTGSSGHDWNYDNWFTLSAAPHFKWENVDYYTVNQFCRASGLECKGYEDAPGLANPAAGDLSLLTTSPNIDRGALIPGLNDSYIGSAPDIGAFESAFSVPLVVSSIQRMENSPTNAAAVNFKVTFSKPVKGVDLAPPFADFSLYVDPGMSGASIVSVAQSSDAVYMVNVNTGSGSGNLRLDLIDDDSITDAAGNPLAGAGAGNGNFNTGDSYVIEKTMPVASSITRTDISPNRDGLVHFNVNFSEEVSGVDAGDFSLSATGALSGYFISEVVGSGASYSVTVNTGTGDGTLRLDLLDNDSILDLTNNPLGGAGAGNANFVSGDSYIINKNIPFVTSILRADPSPTAAAGVRFTVTFSEPVTGVDASDFGLSAFGVADAGIASINGVDSVYTVTVYTGNGNGSIRLDVTDDDSILDAGLSPLGGAGWGNANYTSGESYMIDRATPIILTATFSSDGAHDGWVLESKETSNRGGTLNSKAVTFRVGDNSQDAQYRSILHFPTASLPDHAVITQAILTMQLETVVGTNPFLTHRNMWIDIRQGAFGSFGPFQIGALQASDFQAPASLYTAGTVVDNAVGGWYWASLDARAFPFINLKGATQFRLGFQLDDDDDRLDDYLSFFSGNYSVPSARPQLSVKYYVPK